MALIEDNVMREVQRFAEDDQCWKTDYDAAMKCRTVEYRLARAMAVYDWIVRIDEVWRLSVYQGGQAYDAETHELLTSAFRVWLGASEKLLGDLADIEQQGFTVRQAAEYRARVREAQGSLTDDAEFFSGRELVRLRDEAIDANARGETLEYGAAER